MTCFVSTSSTGTVWSALLTPIFTNLDPNLKHNTQQRRLHFSGNSQTVVTNMSVGEILKVYSLVSYLKTGLDYFVVVDAVWAVLAAPGSHCTPRESHQPYNTS